MVIKSSENPLEDDSVVTQYTCWGPLSMARSWEDSTIDNSIFTCSMFSHKCALACSFSDGADAGATKSKSLAPAIIGL